jgi:hypothetical protein
MGQERAASAKGTVLDDSRDRASGWSGVLRTELPYVEARLTLRPTADGGRRADIHPGYRAHWWVHHPNGECTHHDGPLDLIGMDRLAPGETGDVRILPVAPAFWEDLEIGSTLEMWEGGIVGTATVTSLRF